MTSTNSRTGFDSSSSTSTVINNNVNNRFINAVDDNNSVINYNVINNVIKNKAIHNKVISNNVTNHHVINNNVINPCSFHSLPDELALLVFSHLEPREVLATVSRVCMRWLALHSDPSLYRDLVLAKNRLPTGTALQIISMAGWLRSLEIAYRWDTNEVLKCLAKNAARLHTLIIRCCDGTATKSDVSSKCLLDVLQHCSELEHLSLDGTSCGRGEFYAQIGQRLTSLRRLDLGYASHFASEALMHFAPRTNGVPLEIVHIGESKGDGNFDTALTAFCARFNWSLKRFEMEHVSWSDVTVRAISTCHHLTHVELYSAERVTDEGIVRLGEMPRLVGLTVWRAELVTSDGWIRFFGRRHVRRLKHVELYKCENLDDDVVNVLAKNLKDLMSLSIENCYKVSLECHLWVEQQIGSTCCYYFT